MCLHLRAQFHPYAHPASHRKSHVMLVQEAGPVLCFSLILHASTDLLITSSQCPVIIYLHLYQMTHLLLRSWILLDSSGQTGLVASSCFAIKSHVKCAYGFIKLTEVSKSCIRLRQPLQHFSCETGTNKLHQGSGWYINRHP